MRGETSPAPIYEGEDGVIAWLLDGPDASYRVPLPRRANQSGPSCGPTRRNIPPSTRPRRSSTWPSACGHRCRTWAQVRSIEIYTSHHTHNVIGTGSGDPRKVRPAGEPGDARPLPPLYLCRRPGGRQLGPRGVLRSGSRGHGPRQSSYGARSVPKRTRAGPSATCRERLSGAEPSSRRRRRRASRTRSRWRTPTRSAPGLSAGPSTLEKFRRLARGTSAEPNRSASSSLAQRLLELGPEEVRELNLRVPGLEDETTPGEGCSDVPLR